MKIHWRYSHEETEELATPAVLALLVPCGLEDREFGGLIVRTLKVLIRV